MKKYFLMARANVVELLKCEKAIWEMEPLKTSPQYHK